MAEDRTSSTHPPLPPPTEEGRLDWLRLLRSRRVGPVTFWRLLDTYGSARAALEALPQIAADAGIDSYQTCPAAVAQAEINAGQRAGARLVARGEAHYPPALAELGDAPPLLWIKGRVELLTRPLIAIVGARSASSLGLRMARVLAEELAQEGFCVVSGLARGIDTAVHSATLTSGTIAVLPGGIDVIYPIENAALGNAIGVEGLLVSEHPPALQPLARHFAGRNRLISGMARGVVVVEAAVKSGSLITARNALDQGREVMAVPGHPFDARASGCNLLLRDGAILVRSALDVVEALSRFAAPAKFIESTQPHLDAILPEHNPPATPPRTADRPAEAPSQATLPEGEPQSARPRRSAGHSLPPSQAAFSHAPVQQPAPVQTPAPLPHSDSAAQKTRNLPLPFRADRFAANPLPAGITTPDAGQTPPRPALREIAVLHSQILARLDPAPLQEEDLIAALQSSARLVSPALIELEIAGEIARHPGGIITRKN